MREYSEINKTLHTNVIIGENQKDLDNKLNRITDVTGIPRELSLIHI